MKPSVLLRTGFALFAVSASVSVASATGLLGQRYSSLSYEHVFTQSDRWDDGDGFELQYNQPFAEKADLGLTIQHQKIKAGRDDVLDVTRTRVMAYGVGFGVLDLDIPFARFDVGWGEEKTDAVSESGLAWAFTVGAQWEPSKTIAVTPYLSWTANSNHDVETTFEYGVITHFDVADQFGVLVKLEGDRHANITFGIGGAARF